MPIYTDYGECIYDSETNKWIPKDDNNTDYAALIESGSEIVQYEISFEDARANKIEEIKNFRWQLSTSGITVDGVMIQTDEKSQSAIAIAAQQAQNDTNFTADWQTGTDENGIPIMKQLTADQIIDIAKQVSAHVQDAFSKQDQLFEQVKTAKTIQDLQNIQL